MLFFALLLFPLRFGVDACRTAFTCGEATLSFLPFRLRIPFRIDHHAGALPRLILLSRTPGSLPHPPSPRMMHQSRLALRTLIRSDKARRMLLRFLHLDALDLRLCLALQDASATARAAGLLQGLDGLIPPSFRERVTIRILPDFIAHESRWRFHCIISLPLGILLLTAGMTLIAYARERRRHSDTLKEASHGPSYR